jgi:hypothetical protein
MYFYIYIYYKMDTDKLNKIVEDLALSGFLNDTKKSVKLFNKLKSTEKILKNNYKLDTHANIDIMNKISTLISLHNLPLSNKHSEMLGEIKYAKNYGVNIINNFNIYENGIEIIMINGKYLIIERKWDYIIPEVVIDYYKNITITWVSTSDNDVKTVNNDLEEKKQKKKIKRDTTQIAELHMTLYGIITDLFWIDDKNTNHRENYLPSHISFSRDANHSLCKWFLKYNINKNTNFIIKCCNE